MEGTVMATDASKKPRRHTKKGEAEAVNLQLKRPGLREKLDVLQKQVQQEKQVRVSLAELVGLLIEGEYSRRTAPAAA